MKQSSALFSAFTCLLLVGLSWGGKWERNEFLDRNEQFRMFWNFTDSYITIKLVVNTTGWIGVGFSDDATMVRSDIYVGWVKEGEAFITDRHGVDYSGFPPKDDHQDAELIKGEECNGHTTLIFRRPLKTCDTNDDQAITKSTMRVLFAYNTNDPDGSDIYPWDKHTQRGAKSVLVLDKVDDDFEDGETHNSFSFLTNASLSESRSSTYYYCKILKVPVDFNSTHHIIKIEPVIEHKHFVHHMTLQECPVKLEDPGVVGKGSNCLGGSIRHWRYCIKVVAGWAVGGRSIVFSKNVGFPIGLPGQTRYFKLEIHYDLSKGHEGVVDHSGFRFTYTPQLREHDAGILLVGHYLAGYNLVVPPHTDEFDTYATCGSACLSGAMDKAGVSSINIVNVFLHTHLFGRKVSFRHFRNNTELAPISEDETYDYDFQETRQITPERVVRKGDYLQTKCTYSNAGGATMLEGGLATSEEMCASFLYFYPRIPLTICNAAPTNALSVIKEIVGVKTIRPYRASPNYLLNRFKNLMVTEPEDKAGQTLDVVINKFPWNSTLRNSLSDRLRDSPILQMCVGPQPEVQFQGVIPPFPHLPQYREEAPSACVNQSTSITRLQTNSTCLPTNL